MTQVVLMERQGRDRAWWEQMRNCFHPDSEVVLRWFIGSGFDFVAASEEQVRKGNIGLHRLSPPVIHLAGDRAFVELPAAVEVRRMVSEVEVDVSTFIRLLYRVERHEGRWLIRRISCIYERDNMIPVVPGSEIDLDPDVLARGHLPTRFGTYLQELRGHTPFTSEIYMDEEPAKVERLYLAEFEWLDGVEET